MTRHPRGVRTSRKGEAGSVLSGFLIVIALIGLVAAALLPEVSAHLMAGRAAALRVEQDATLAAALEYRTRTLQASPLASPVACAADPLNNTATTVSLNGMTATATYVCKANTGGYATGPTQLSGIRYNPFTTDGAHFQAGAVNELVVGDSPASGGWLYDYQFGVTSPLRWRLDLGAAYSGRLSAAAAGGVFGGSSRILAPLSVSGAACGLGVSSCVMEINDPPSAPGGCAGAALPASAGSQVLSAPAVGIAAPNNVYFGDSTGVIWVYDGLNCTPIADSAGDARRPVGPVVAGPFVVSPASKDEVYALVTTAAGSVQPSGVPAPATLLVHYTCKNPSCSNFKADSGGPLTLWNTASAVGMGSILAPAPGVSAGIAATGTDGSVATAAILTNASMALVASGKLPGANTTRSAPALCPTAACGALSLGVTTDQGNFYVLDTIALGTLGSYSVPGTPQRTTPAVDAAGNWFFGADDGYLYQVQGSGATFVDRYGPVGGVRSSPVIGACGAAATCVYFGTQASDSATYMVQYTPGMVSRNGYIYACISSPAPTCTKAQRLWARVVATGSTAKLGAWSYYLP